MHFTILSQRLVSTFLPLSNANGTDNNNNGNSNVYYALIDTSPYNFFNCLKCKFVRGRTKRKVVAVCIFFALRARLKGGSKFLNSVSSLGFIFYFYFFNCRLGQKPAVDVFAIELETLNLHFLYLHSFCWHLRLTICIQCCAVRKLRVNIDLQIPINQQQPLHKSLCFSYLSLVFFSKFKYQ